MVFVNSLSYHKRLFMLIVTFTWAIVVCFLIFQYGREKQFKSDFLNAQLQLYNQHLLNSIQGGTSYQTSIETLDRPFNDLRITLITKTGYVIYDSEMDASQMENHYGRPEVKDAIRHGSGYQIERMSESNGWEYFYSATKGDFVIVRTAIPYSASLRELLKEDWAFLWAVISLSLIFSVIAYFFTKRLGKVIRRLNLFAEKAERGEPFDDFGPFPNDELGSISNHIIQLYSQLEHTIEDRDREHAAAMLQEQEKIRIKRQLTNNINHELKTPLASIQVCLETLLSGIKLSDEKRQELIERCYVNNDRLRRLLNDVSLITRMEDGNQQIGKETVSLNEIISDVADELEILPENERLQLQVDFKDDVSITGNLSLISSIFCNLTENAIAYSGGKNIYITLLENNDKYCRIRFEDDGTGVEEKHLPHLFERFYRVDKGRSRQKGGTGLGLAIVKHAVIFHGGSINVTNRPEGGLRFEFSLSKTGIPVA